MDNFNNIFSNLNSIAELVGSIHTIYILVIMNFIISLIILAILSFMLTKKIMKSKQGNQNSFVNENAVTTSETDSIKVENNQE